jgi:hypothetical protein
MTLINPNPYDLSPSQNYDQYILGAVNALKILELSDYKQSGEGTRLTQRRTIPGPWVCLGFAVGGNKILESLRSSTFVCKPLTSSVLH